MKLGAKEKNNPVLTAVAQVKYLMASNSNIIRGGKS